MSLRRAILFSVSFVFLALSFAVILALIKGEETASLFLAGYVLEKSLSIDNLLVFAAIFSFFKIKDTDQPFILNLGILGAIVLRAFFILLGAGALLLAGSYTGVLFGLIVIWSAFKMLKGQDDEGEEDYEKKWFVKLAKKLGTSPSFLCLVSIEVSDIIFSFDSMPAVFSITQDPLLVYSSVMFAVLGLRSLYFVLSALMKYLIHLEKAVIVILFFVGFKMTIHSLSVLFNTIDLKVNPLTNLAVVLGLLLAGVLASILLPRKA